MKRGAISLFAVLLLILVVGEAFHDQVAKFLWDLAAPLVDTWSSTRPEQGMFGTAQITVVVGLVIVFAYLIFRCGIRLGLIYAALMFLFAGIFVALEQACKGCHIIGFPVAVLLCYLGYKATEKLHRESGKQEKETESDTKKIKKMKKMGSDTINKNNE